MSGVRAALDRRFAIEEYLVWSTVIALLMWVPIKTPAFQSGYIVVILNSLALLTIDGLTIHRNHLLAILLLAIFGVIGTRLSGTPLNVPASQILGISVTSVYFFSALTNFGLPLSRWMELYTRAAFALAIFALIAWPAIGMYTGDWRLRAVYSEPSFYIYVTLPAVGFCVNRFIHERRYGPEVLIFLLSYILADSALGFLGLMLVALFSYAPRLKGWKMLAGGALFAALCGGLYFASANFQLRARDTAVALVTQNLSGTSPSTFALLSNAYVASQSFLEHPLTGIGIGGFARAYDKYVSEITGTNLTDLFNMQLNRDDANSMFLRVAAELGLPGLLVLLGFLIVCARVKGTPHLQIRNAILPYLLIRMGRGGHYFSVELYFFIGIYLLNYLESCRARHAINAESAA
ncbi:MAG TPA: O-antigen ligase family protein [Rhizomicrobium sp.]|nr:O-antigen ligase family protein [Rhizomicrobium sp.]